MHAHTFTILHGCVQKIFPCLFLKLIYFLQWVFCLRVSLYTTCAWCLQSPEEGVSGPLGLELQMIGSFHVAWRTWVQKSSQYLYL